MKIRIKGNSLRLRLAKSEVEHFCNTGYIEEHTEFNDSSFCYAMQKDDQSKLTAMFSDNKITILFPADKINEWKESNKVGYETFMPLKNGKKLFLLVEKDFKCLDENIEDQSDNYDNPLLLKQ